MLHYYVNTFMAHLNIYCKGVQESAFWIAQVPFAFEFECNRLNGNLATVCHRIIIQQIEWNQLNVNLVTFCHWITIQQICKNLPNGNSVTKSHRIPFTRLHSNSNANGIWGILNSGKKSVEQPIQLCHHLVEKLWNLLNSLSFTVLK